MHLEEKDGDTVQEQINGKEWITNAKILLKVLESSAFGTS